MLWWTLQQLKSKEPGKRRSAVEKLAKSEFAAAQEAFDFALQDPDPEVRRFVITTLLNYSDPAAVKLAARGLKDSDDSVKETTAELLARLRNPALADILMAAMKDASSVVRFHAAKGLEALGWHPENNLQQAVFWVALGQLEKAAGLGAIAIEPLTLMLRDRYYYKRQAALEAVSRIDDARVPKLVRDALRDNDRNVRLSAVEMLANIRDPLSVDPLIKAIQSTDSQIRARSVAALGKLGNPVAAEPISRLLRDSNWEVRLAAVSSLGALNASSHYDAIVGALKDHDAEVRMAAIGTLGRFADPRAVEPLVPMLKDEHEDVRKKARSVLVKLDSSWMKSPLAQKAIPALRAALQHKEYLIRQAAREVLEQMGAREFTDAAPVAVVASSQQQRQVVFEIFSQLLDDADRDLRLAAVQAMGNLPDPRTIDRLASSLSDKDESVSGAAAISLRSMDWHPPTSELAERFQSLASKTP